MDRMTLSGLVLGLGALFGTLVLEGGHPASLLQGPAALIVFLGTLGATLISCSSGELRSAVRACRDVFAEPRLRTAVLPAFFRDLAFIARKDGLIALDKTRVRFSSPFADRALRHLIDGCDPAQLEEILSSDSNARHRRDLEGAEVLEIAGGYAPTMGILGAVLGLIRAMESLDEPEALGAGIAVAFIATVYGVGLANLVLLPMAAKVRQRVLQRQIEDRMVIEGALGLQNGTSPRMIERQLAA